MTGYTMSLWGAKPVKNTDRQTNSDVNSGVEALIRWLSTVSECGMTTISVDLVKNKLRSITNNIEKR